VSETRRIEGALRDRERLLDRIAHAMPDILYLGDALEGTHVYLNRGLESLLGYPAESFADPSFLKSLLHPDDRAAEERRRSELQSAADGDVVVAERRFRARTGRYRWVRSREVVLARDRAGSAHVVLGIGQDVTEQRKTEDRLRASEARYRRVVDDQTELICRVDGDLRLTFFNPAYERCFGAPGLDLLGRSVLDFIPSEDRAAAAEYLDGVRAGRYDGPRVYRVRRADGEIRWQEWNTRVFRGESGSGVEIQAVGRDVTDRVAAEQALRASEERYRTVVNVLHEGIMTFDVHGVITSCNPSGLRILRGTAADVVGRSVCDPAWNTARPDGTPLAAEERPVMATLLTGRAVHGMVFGTTAADGARVWISVNSVPMIDATGRLVGAVGSFTDISGLVRAERELRELSGRLLRAQDDERRRIAHALHDSTAQELAALAMNIEVAVRAAGALPPAAQAALAEARGLAEAAGRSVRTLSHVLHPPLLDDVGLAPALRWFCTRFASRSGLELAVDVPETLGRLDREVETTTFRVVQEALVNAWRHAHATRIQVTLAHQDGRLRVEVRDDGRGLPAEMCDTSGRPAMSGGTGLAGLRERVRLAGGSLELRAPDGGGSVVRAMLPAREEGA
jgi:PAS domain S-box-containing protein